MTVPDTIVVDSFEEHPWIVRLSRYVELAHADIDAILSILEGQRQIRKRADIVVEGYRYRKFCFIEAGMASRYKLLHNGKRQILDVLLPGDIIGFPTSFYDRANISVVALTNMSLQACPFEAFMEACFQRPLLTMALLWLAVEERLSTPNASSTQDAAARSSAWHIFSWNYICDLRGWATPRVGPSNCLCRRK